MLKVFYGANRVEAEKAIKRALGEGYEVFDGETLTLADLPSIFRGTSLFETEKRRILLKNVSENTAVWEKIADYKNTDADVVIWELKLDKRSAGYKNLTAEGVELKEFPELVGVESKIVFNLLDLALRDGMKAVKEAEKIEQIQDPYMAFGLFVTQALKKFDQSGGATRERRILKKLSKLDMTMKTSGMDPWLLLKGFLLEIGK